MKVLQYLVLFVLVTNFSRSPGNFSYGLRELGHSGRGINFLLCSETNKSSVIRHGLQVTLYTFEYGKCRLKTFFWLNNCILKVLLKRNFRIRDFFIVIKFERYLQTLCTFFGPHRIAESIFLTVRS